jgi:hypothetical protein
MYKFLNPLNFIKEYYKINIHHKDYQRKIRDRISNFVFCLLSNHLLKSPFIKLFFNFADVFDEHRDAVRSLFDEFSIEGFSLKAASSADRVVSRIVPRIQFDMFNE